MNQTQKGFTLIELLVVIGIIGLLAATLLPAIFGGKLTADIAADQGQLTRHYAWLTEYQHRFKSFPTEGGHKFVLDTWCKNIAEHSDQNLAFYFNPRTRVAGRYQELRKLDVDTVFTDLRSVTSDDTDYAGRAKKNINGNMVSGKEAWMADDNELGWAFPNGSINVLYGDGHVRELTYEVDLKDKFGLGPIDPNGAPFQTWGPSSLHPDLQKLDR
jgi:prepilin-type N-terminal cleavage/methylation domain-containing protein/prepilin-type processing-associated H-X9-DG protein